MAADESIFRPAPSLKHALAVAYRFNDVFTGTAIVEPLTVAIPERRWVAYRSGRDFTYRFLVSNGEPIPSGTFGVSVEAAGGEYRSVEPIEITLPLPPIAHPPPVVALDFLRQAPLWPTRRKSLPVAETAVLGRIASSSGATAVSGLRVFLFESPGPAPSAPFASADEAGDFVFRLPQLGGSLSGGTAVTDQTLAVELSDGSAGVAVNPGTITVPLGRVSVVELTVA